MKKPSLPKARLAKKANKFFKAGIRGPHIVLSAFLVGKPANIILSYILLAV